MYIAKTPVSCVVCISSSNYVFIVLCVFMACLIMNATEHKCPHEWSIKFSEFIIPTF